ncbi:hypothetical protein N7462_004983 [Penicillium macrosclerotiorum]|uniref:uncharacterized protein n=1 Tax=Penicillium macrosclerotiorum TaxID=303699 RepID=UPI00254741FB|nr:uncharacterized protein N7462_004983 [Penicillium macrosclerotiorum]KAJ5690591.1 hypothetical protein N7462_004983 [Penicillium macrosclerotiorum]
MASTELVDVSTACARRQHISTIGVVVDTLPPIRTRGSSMCVTFTIKDCHFDKETWYGGLKIKYFNDNISALPAVQINDVILLRNIRVSMFKNKLTGVASQHDRVPWAIFRSESDPSSGPSITTGPIPFPLKQLEKRAALMLLDGATGCAQPAVLSPAPRESPQVVQAFVAPKPKPGYLPLSLIEDLQPGQLTQLLGQVVKINTYNSDRCIIYLTDYTTNPALIDIKKDDEDIGSEGDTYDYLSRKKKDWPGPWGQMSIQVTLWEPHANFARERLKGDELVLITYSHVKPGRGNGIEAAVHEDKRYPEKVHIRIISNDYNDRSRALTERRKEYWKIHGKPSMDPKKAEKKKKNQQRKKEEKVEEGQNKISVTKSRTKTNENIKTRSYDVPVRSVNDILSGESHVNTLPGGISYQLPFQNVCYRLQARVVDYFPPNLEDFAVQVPMDSIVTGHDDENAPSAQRMEWEWRFCLLVEGTDPVISKNQARAQMKLFVTGAEGVHLLSLDPADLRVHPRRLAELREKLFILWGDLEERKRDHDATQANRSIWVPPKPSSLPFICCIKEYGVRCSHSRDPDAMQVDGAKEELCMLPDCFGWERRFAMFGTTIHS